MRKHRVVKPLAALAIGAAATGAAADTLTITVTPGGTQLAGTFEAPTTPPRAAALILPGSGPTDRNGNSPLGITANSYQLLAEALAARGIATLRVDKRGIGESGGDANAVSLALYRADTDAWTSDLRTRAGVECVWLIGHSEGAILALASADLPGICGLILLTPPGRPLGDILLDQIAAIPRLSSAVSELEAAIDALILGQEPELATLPPELATMIGGPARAYLTELLQTSPATLVAETDLPTLIIHGDADIQVPPSEAIPLQQARPDATFQVLSGLTHVLKTAIPRSDAPSSEVYAEASLATYTSPDIPLHAELAPALTDFITAHQ